MNQSRWVGKIWLSVLAFLSRAPGPLARRFADVVQPSNPIRIEESLPAVEILISCSEKDFHLLHSATHFAGLNSVNPVSSISIVVPDYELDTAAAAFQSGVFRGENELLPQGLIASVEQHHPSGRYGWILQQVIGLYFAWSSSAEGVLVIDADTMLTRPRVWLDGNRKQLLSLSHEYYEPYESHAESVWGGRKRHFGLSYVTHHQLMQPWVVREMFPEIQDIIRWVRAASTEIKSPLADYHSYGRWLCDNYPELAFLARWENKSVSRTSLGSLNHADLEKSIRERFPDYFSVSLHSYLH